MTTPGYVFFERMGSPVNIIAPMVDQSDLAFRMLCRRYGAHLCYTQMFSSNSVVSSADYRRDNFTTCSQDRPLIVQIAGHDPAVMLKAASYFQDDCDAIDVNLGCPQGIAKRGRYGAFLMEELNLLSDIVSTLAHGLKIPVTCKTRIYKDFERSVRLCETLVNAGASMLCIHGRTREEKGNMICVVDWHMLHRLKQHFGRRVPIIANGGIECVEDVRRCLAVTGMDGVMSSEAVLENPALFTKNLPWTTWAALTLEMEKPDIEHMDSNAPSSQTPASDESPMHATTRHSLHKSQIDLAEEYLEMCAVYPVWHIKAIRSHLMKMLHRYFVKYPQYRDELGIIHSIEEMQTLCQKCRACIGDRDMEFEKFSWYRRHRHEEDDNSHTSEHLIDSNKGEDNNENCIHVERREGRNKHADKDFTRDEMWGCEDGCDSIFDALGMF